MTSTIIMGILLYLMVVVWQPLWTGGFEDFGKISEAIEDLDATAKPAVAIVPNIFNQINLMNQNMIRMDSNVAQIKDAMIFQMGMLRV